MDLVNESMGQLPKSLYFWLNELNSLDLDKKISISWFERFKKRRVSTTIQTTVVSPDPRVTNTRGKQEVIKSLDLSGFDSF